MSISILCRSLWSKYSGQKEFQIPETETYHQNLSTAYHTWTMDFRDGDAVLTTMKDEDSISDTKSANFKNIN